MNILHRLRYRATDCGHFGRLEDVADEFDDARRRLCQERATARRIQRLRLVNALRRGRENQEQAA